ncbi:hypothetical protein KDW_39320 [Dictyobacter vulcani]|uniref:Uncharacterized protein n=1 Tax=Dictyobacter vulcani TaxID=2607529 RepID=A0A5J4KTG6_9CHLR|nr:hypothetical protein KDW_39320 [Dictyobacter vulcani]
MLAVSGAVLNHLIWRFHLSQLMTAVTLLPSTLFLAFLSPFLLALVPIAGRRFTTIAAVFGQPFFQFQIAQTLFEQLPSQFLDVLILLFHLLLQFAVCDFQLAKCAL